MYPLPKKYYLIVHDAIRKVLGPDGEISAFVTSKKPFQCDMLVNAGATDPDTAGSVREFASRLQRCLGTCDVAVRRRRLDVVFLDREVLRLALGAPRHAVGNLRSPLDINKEPEWARRNRLRISLGYDEDLFLAECDLKTSLAARIMEKWVFDTYFDSTRESKETFMQSSSPPVTYWLAHGYDLAQNFHVDHHVTLAGTISQNFAAFYGEFPFDNPYCPGEDLNSMRAVRWLCEAWKEVPLKENRDAAMEMQLDTETSSSDNVGEKMRK